MNPASPKTAPSTEKPTVSHGRRPNAAYRVREYLTERASELCGLRWDQIDLTHARLHVRRAKNGIDSVHPLTGVELRALRRLQREQGPGTYVFLSERGAPMSVDGVQRMIARAGEVAKMPFPIHPHMLRHACGFKLANQGVDTRSLQHYLGHKQIQHTVRYTELSPDRFKDFWRD
jgi:type 1 fimbriae regulatory protein FimB/type 1 fimbriae regulatory protein FimE